uniref:Leucine-rich repeat-containing protein 63 n=1 Tax=Schistosoma haematobium TaxID=6185 RepID=A0A094ZHG1_SCHHA
MDGLILFRRPRKIPKSKLSENNNNVYKPRETKISIAKKNSASNSHLPISNSIVFSSTGTTINFMNKNKNKRQARELRNALTRTIDTNIICSIEKIPRNFQQSLNNYQVNYAIILKEKLNQNQLIWYDSSEENTMKLIKFQKNLKFNEFYQATYVKPEQVKLLDSYYSGGSSVSLEACQLKYLPDLSAFYVTLRFLNLSRNYLEDLPNDFCLLNNLEFLSLRSNPLHKVPKSIAKLKQLKSLNLSYCLIENLTYEHLKVLKLNGNDLTGIPPGLLCLCEKALESLNLNDNPLLCLFPKEFKNNSLVEIQSLRVLACLKMRDLLNDMNIQNQGTSREKPEQYILITNSEENNANFFEFQKVSDKEESTMSNELLSPIGSCCWCGMDRYDQKNTICIHCVDVFKYSTVPICMLCCGIQCVTEVKQCSTSEQFAKRYYKSYENYTNR